MNRCTRAIAGLVALGVAAALLAAPEISAHADVPRETAGTLTADDALVQARLTGQPVGVDGRLRPEAAVVASSVSTGGSADLVEVEAAHGSMSWSWPTVLPPAVDLFQVCRERPYTSVMVADRSAQTRRPRATCHRCGTCCVRRDVIGAVASGTSAHR